MTPTKKRVFKLDNDGKKRKLNTIGEDHALVVAIVTDRLAITAKYMGRDERCYVQVMVRDSSERITDMDKGISALYCTCSVGRSLLNVIGEKGS